MSEDLFKEIDADMRIEKLRNVARRYLFLAITIVLIVIISLGVWQFKKSQHHKAIEQASLSYFKIQQDINPMSGKAVSNIVMNNALGQLKALSANSPQSIRAFSQLEQAALLANQGKLKEASVIWNALRADTTADPDFRSLASFLWIQHSLDTANPVDLRTRISELLGQQTPWNALLKECEALLDLRTGKIIEAQRIFGQLSSDMNAPQGVRQRAGAMLQVIVTNKITDSRVAQ